MGTYFHCGLLSQVDITNRAIEAAKDYSKNIDDYKRVPSYNIPGKVRRKKEVRASKRQLRQVNEELQSHYCVRLFPPKLVIIFILVTTELVI